MSYEPIPDYLPNVTVIFPVAARTTGSSNPAVDKQTEDAQVLHNLNVGCGSYQVYYEQLKAAMKQTGVEPMLKAQNLTIDAIFPPIQRELIVVTPGRQKPVLPQTGQRPLAADLRKTVAESYFTVMEDSICEATPRLLQPHDPWLNTSSTSYQTLAMELNVSDALRSVEEAHYDLKGARMWSIWKL